MKGWWGCGVPGADAGDAEDAVGDAGDAAGDAGDAPGDVGFRGCPSAPSPDGAAALPKRREGL